MLEDDLPYLQISALFMHYSDAGVYRSLVHDLVYMLYIYKVQLIIEVLLPVLFVFIVTGSSMSHPDVSGYFQRSTQSQFTDSLALFYFMKLGFIVKLKRIQRSRGL